MLHMTKSIATEASHIGQTIAKGRIKGAAQNWVNLRLAVHGRLLELILNAATDILLEVCRVELCIKEELDGSFVCRGYILVDFLVDPGLPGKSPVILLLGAEPCPPGAASAAGQRSA